MFQTPSQQPVPEVAGFSEVTTTKSAATVIIPSPMVGVV
jgi:hypothetical protein